MKTAYIFCRQASIYGYLDFYLETDHTKYYLFRQRYCTTTYRRFRNKLTVNEALNFKKARHVQCTERVIQKLPASLRYLEKQYSIQILRTSGKKSRYVSDKHFQTACC